jgi:hypothetical protein
MDGWMEVNDNLGWGGPLIKSQHHQLIGEEREDSGGEGNCHRKGEEEESHLGEKSVDKQNLKRGMEGWGKQSKVF